MQQGIDVARRQNAKSWELRGATSLARLRRQQGRHEDAVALLAPVLGWFQEGFDTVDVQAARTLLDELENSVALEAACDSLALKRGSMQIRACARAQ